MVGGAVTGRAERIPGTGASGVIATVQEAMAHTPTVPRRRGGASASELPIALQRLSWLFALYMCYTSFRIQEIIPAFGIPKFPMVVSLVLAGTLAIATPGATWAQLWRETSVLRWQSLLVVLAIVTIPTGIWMGRSFSRIWPGYFLSTTVFCCALVLLRDRQVLLRLLRILTLALGGLTALVLSGVAASGVGAEGRLMVGDSLDPNDFASILVTFIPIAVMLGILSRRMLPIWWGSAVLFMLGIVSTQSRGGFLAVIAAASVLLLYGTSGWRRVVLSVTLAAVGFGLVTYINATGASRLTDFSGYSGGTGRTQLWTQGLKWMIQRPWGYGMGNYETYNVWMTRDYHSAHSAFVNIGVELGILGLVAFIAIWRFGIKGLVRVRRAAITGGSRVGASQEITLSGFLLASVVAHITAAAFINTQYSALSLFVQALAAAAVLGSPFNRASETGVALRPTSLTHPRLRRAGSGAP